MRFPRLAALAGTTALAGVNENDFEELATKVTAALAHWAEFADATSLPATQRDHASSIHQGLATSLSIESPVRGTKRPKVWWSSFTQVRIPRHFICCVDSSSSGLLAETTPFRS